MTHQPIYKPCERCGIPVMVGGRKRLIWICSDCRYTDREYLRLRGVA